MTEETWAPVKGKDRDYWKPEKKGDERIGTLLRGEAGEYKGKPTMQYVIMGDDEKETYTPNHAVLNGKLLTVKAGSRVKIVYQGTGEKKKKGQNAAEMYDVFVSNAPRQAGLTETPPVSPPVPQADRIKKILEDLTFGQGMFPGHVIPEVNIKAACGDEATFKHLKDAGLICMSDSADAPKGIQCWRVTI